MKRPAVAKSSFLFLVKVACVGLALAITMVFNGLTQAQSSNKVAANKITVKSDRRNPRRPPEKLAPTSKVGNQSGAPTAPRPPAAAPQALSPSSPQGCDYGTILVRDTIRVIYVELFNYPENSVIPVTMTQTNAGTVGYCLTDAGPFNPTLDIVVNTDASGYGISAPVFTQGQIVGPTIAYGDTPYGATTTIDFNVLPQCNCPPIPVVP